MFRSWFLPRRFLFLSLAVASVFAQAPNAQKPHGQTGKPPIVKEGVIHFEDIAPQAGLNMLNVSGGDAHKEFIIETLGNGAVIFDYDNDGWPDIYLPIVSTVQT